MSAISIKKRYYYMRNSLETDALVCGSCFKLESRNKLTILFPVSHVMLLQDKLCLDNSEHITVINSLINNKKGV